MSETTDKIVDKIVGDATSRLKIPIVSTYLCVLIIHNWDILYFIFFSNVDATSKILYVKNHYNFWDYLCRVGGSLLYAIGILILFTFIDYYLVKWLKNVSIRKKGLQQQIVDHNTIKDLNTLISTLRDKVNKLNDENLKQLDFNSQHVNKINILNSDISTLENKINNDIDIIRFGNFMNELIKIDNEFNLQKLKMVLLNLNNRLKDKNVVLFSEIFRNHELTNGPDGIKPIHEIVLLLIKYEYLNMKEIKIGSYELSYNKNIDFIYSLYNIKTTP